MPVGRFSAHVVITVLVVDDDDSARYALCKILRRMGHGVEEATNIRDALDICRTRGDSISVVIAEVAMPGGGGAELIQWLRARELRFGAILMSAGLSDGEMSTLESETGIPVLSKPECGHPDILHHAIMDELVAVTSRL